MHVHKKLFLLLFGCCVILVINDPILRIENCKVNNYRFLSFGVAFITSLSLCSQPYVAFLNIYLFVALFT